MRLPDWFPGVKWHRAHEAAWAPELLPDAEGFSLFARLTEAAILQHLAVLGEHVTSRYVHSPERRDPGDTVWVEPRVGNSLRIWIYNDQWDIVGPGVDFQCEMLDAESPVASRQLALARLSSAFEMLRGRRGT